MMYNILKVKQDDMDLVHDAKNPATHRNLKAFRFSMFSRTSSSKHTYLRLAQHAARNLWPYSWTDFSKANLS